MLQLVRHRSRFVNSVACIALHPRQHNHEGCWFHWRLPLLHLHKICRLKETIYEVISRFGSWNSSLMLISLSVTHDVFLCTDTDIKNIFFNLRLASWPLLIHSYTWWKRVVRIGWWGSESRLGRGDGERGGGYEEVVVEMEFAIGTR